MQNNRILKTMFDLTKLPESIENRIAGLEWRGYHTVHVLSSLKENGLLN